MGLFTKDIKTLDDLFVHTLQDIYYAENQIVKALPKMIEKGDRAAAQAGSAGASRGDQGSGQAARAGVPDAKVEIEGVDCPAIDGIIEEADEVTGDVADKDVLDAALIAAAQAVEHYEITRYGTLGCLGEAARPRRLRRRARAEPR